MSTLTAEELKTLRKRVVDRYEEFNNANLDVPSLGDLRLVIDVYHEWLENDPSRPWPAAEDGQKGQGGPMMDGYHVGYHRGYAEAERVLAIPVTDNPEGDPHVPEHIRVILARWVQNMGALASDLRLEIKPSFVGTLLAESLTLRATFNLYDLLDVSPPADPPPLNYDVPDLEAAGKAAKAAIEAIAARTITPRKCDEKSTAADAPEPPQKSDEKLTGEATPAEPTAPAVPRLRTQEVKPPDPDVARDRLAHALASGSNGSLASATISRTRTLDEADREAAARAEEIDAVVASLQAMAVDGEMPTVARWEAERVGDLPSWKTLARVHGLAWVDLARKAGLRYARQGSLEDEVKAAREKAAGKGHDRLVSYEMLVAEIKRIAMGNAMPTQAQFDQSKPALWPTANALVTRLETSWADLADVLGLDLQRGRRRSAK